MLASLFLGREGLQPQNSCSVTDSPGLTAHGLVEPRFVCTLHMTLRLHNFRICTALKLALQIAPGPLALEPLNAHALAIRLHCETIRILNFECKSPKVLLKMRASEPHCDGTGSKIFQLQRNISELNAENSNVTEVPKLVEYDGSWRSGVMRAVTRRRDWTTTHANPHTVSHLVVELAL
jgi:hypothetical protein